MPTVAIPTSASATAAIVLPSTPEKKRGERRQRHDLGRDEEGEHRERLAEPDRTAVAGSEHERVEHPLLALGDERAGQPQQRREDERSPEQPERGGMARSVRQGEVEDRQRGDHEEQHRRQRLLRAQLQQQILARQCRTRH